MLDFELILGLCKKRGRSFAQLSRAVERDENALRRQLKKRPWTIPAGLVDAMADYLHLPSQVFNPSTIMSGDGWKRFELAQTRDWQDFHQELQTSRDCLTITRGVECYLQSFEMTRWTSTVWLGNPGWDQRLQLTKDYRSHIDTAREKGHFIHRVISPAALFKRAVNVQPAWLEEMLRYIDSYDRQSVLSLVEDWSGFDKAVQDLLPTWNGRWEKITIVDGLFALIRGSVERYAITYEPSLVEPLLRQCEQLAAAHMGEQFPAAVELKSRRRLAEIEDHLRTSFHRLLRQSSTATKPRPDLVTGRGSPSVPGY